MTGASHPVVQPALRKVTQNYADRDTRALFKMDRPFVAALAFSVLLFGPFSHKVLTFGSHYYVEIGIVAFLIVLSRLVPPPEGKVIRRALGIAVLSFCLLLPFTIVALARGVPMGDAYSTIRAMIVLAVSTTVLFSIDAQASLRFIALSSTFCLVAFAIAYVGGFEDFLLPPEVIENGKLPLPWLAFMTACVFFAYYGRPWMWIACLAGMSALALQTAYRQAMIATVLTLFVCAFCPFLKRRKLKAIGWASIGAGCVTASLMLRQLGLTQIVATLMFMERMARGVGVSEAVIQQVITKNFDSVASDVNTGDNTYRSYWNSLLDFDRFAVPRGIGQKSSYGSSVIFGGNTIDNSVIFFNYHFSIWVTLMLLATCIVEYSLLTRRARFQDHVQYVFLLLPVIFLVYMRAVFFVEVMSALSLALMLRLLGSLIKVQSRSTTGEGCIGIGQDIPT